MDHEWIESMERELIELFEIPNDFRFFFNIIIFKECYLPKKIDKK